MDKETPKRDVMFNKNFEPTPVGIRKRTPEEVRQYLASEGNDECRSEMHQRLPRSGDAQSNESHVELIQKKRDAIFKLENEYQDLCLASETLNQKRMALLEQMTKAKNEYINICSEGFKYQ